MSFPRAATTTQTTAQADVNDGRGGGWWRRAPRRGGVRARVSAGMVAGLVLLVAGCGGGRPGASVASLGTTAAATTSSASVGSVAGGSGPVAQTSSGAGGGGRFSLVGGGSVGQLTKYSVCMRKNG